MFANIIDLSTCRGKKCGTRSDCSRSRLIWVYTDYQKVLQRFIRRQKQKSFAEFDTLKVNFVDVYTVPDIEGAQEAAKKQVVDLEKANTEYVEKLQTLVAVRILNSALFYFYFSNATDAIFHKG